MNLKPCVIFDIDETIVKTPYSPREVDVSYAIPIGPMVFLYNAIDEMINSPPFRVESEKLNANWPKDIFFITARSEELRDATVKSLMHVTGDCYSAISKRLLMRPVEMNCVKNHTSYVVKMHLCEVLKDKGFYASLVFEDNAGALKAFRESFPEAFLLRADPLEEVEHTPLNTWMARANING